MKDIYGIEIRSRELDKKKNTVKDFVSYAETYYYSTLEDAHKRLEALHEKYHPKNLAKNELTKWYLIQEWEYPTNPEHTVYFVAKISRLHLLDEGEERGE